jgi:hypothetical protein
MFINLKPWLQHRGFLSVQGIYCHHVSNIEWGLNHQRMGILEESNCSGEPLVCTKCIAFLCDDDGYFSTSEVAEPEVSTTLIRKPATGHDPDPVPSISHPYDLFT